MRKVNLFIAGAARSGTTSLWQYLKIHDTVLMPEDELGKEPSYFSDIGKKMTLSEYQAIFSQANQNHKWIGEASVAYLTDPESPGKIFEYNPNAKIIILLRNPVDRAYSLYNWMTGDGYEYASSFEEALKLEETRCYQKDSAWYTPNYYWGYMYFSSGLYHDQVKRYLEKFENNVLIIKFESFIRNPKSIMKRIYFFLNIKPQDIPIHIHNSSKAIFSPKIQFILRKMNNHIIQSNKKGIELKEIEPSLKGKYREFVQKLSQETSLSLYEKIAGNIIMGKISNFLKKQENPFPYKIVQSKKARDRLLCFGQKKGIPPSQNAETRKRLLKKYQTDIVKLTKLTNMDFSDWMR